MNLQVLKPSRKKPRPGDLFLLRLHDDDYLFGRVIRTDAKAGWSMSGAILIYIYRAISKSPELPEPEQLAPDNLLVPPMMTNTRPWSRGYFETVMHRPVTASDVLPRHCFRSSAGKYYDDDFVELPAGLQPCGEWGLHSFQTIDDEISYALGIGRSS